MKRQYNKRIIKNIVSTETVLFDFLASKRRQGPHSTDLGQTVQAVIFFIYFLVYKGYQGPVWDANL